MGGMIPESPQAKPKAQHPYAPVLIVLLVAGVAAWVWTGDWRWGATGLLAFIAAGAVGASMDRRAQP